MEVGFRANRKALLGLSFTCVAHYGHAERWNAASISA